MQLSRLIVFATRLLLVLLCAAPALAATNDWTRWRGPGGSGVAPDAAGFPLEWTLSNLLWKVPIEGEGHSSPVLSGGRIFLTSAIEGAEIPGASAPEHTFAGQEFKHPQAVGADREHTLLVIALDAESGQILWRHVAHQGRVYDDRHKDSSYASPTCATDGERVFAYFGSEGIHAYSVDGEKLWQREIGKIKTVGLGVASSPVLWGDVVILQADEDSGDASFIVALDKRTGEEVWKQPRAVQVSWSTPLLVERGGKAQLITVGNELIVSYDPGTGREIWRADGLSSNAIHNPLISGDAVIFTSGYPQKVLFSLPLDLEGDLTGQDVKRWSYGKGPAYVPSNVIVDGRLYMINDQGVMTALDAATGEIVFEGGRPPEGGRYMASLVAADGKILQINRSGDATWIKAGATYEVLASTSIDEPVAATPALVGNRIYVRSQGHLYAFGGE